MVEGYQRRSRAQGVYFREFFALTYNINRSEKTPYLDPKDVLLLPGEKKPRKKRDSESSKWSDAEIAEAARKHSAPPPTQAE